MPSCPRNETCYASIVAGATLNPYVRVKLHTDGTILAAGVTERCIGYLTERGATSGQLATVKLLGEEVVAVAAGAIEVGDVCWAAASGKVNDVDAGSGLVVGIANTAAAADGDFLKLYQTDYVS